MISVDEALESILDQIGRLDSRETSILDALGLVLDEDIVSDVDIPPFTGSAMDGYAVRAADVTEADANSPVTLAVVGDLAAGYVAERPVGKGEALRIMTGAPLPEGADSIVMVEQTEKEGDRVRIFKSVAMGENVRPAGEDVAKGETILKRGKPLRPGDIGMLASVGRLTANLVRRPKVGVLATGDELIDPSEPLKPGKIRNSNAYSLSAQVVEAGGEPLLLGIARDTREDLTDRLERGLAEADLLITSGGVSVGDYDLVKQVLMELGEMVLWKVAMKPGKPLAFGLIRGKPLFGLPGYPTSSMISFEQFVRPAILKMAGRVELRRPEVEVIVDDAISKKAGRRHYLRVVVERRNGELHARLTGTQRSGALRSMTIANALLVIPEEVTAIEAGGRGRAQLLHEA